MKIELKEISIREVVEGYTDDNEGGVFGYNGKLDIRPPYQREFRYKEAKKRDAVIDTVRKDFPLNVMYWVKNGDKYEVLDGQQRTISIAQYVVGDYSINHQFFHNLEEDEKEQILDYKLMIYFCEGTDKQKLDWFGTINIAGEKLTKQELLNAIYTGPWLADAKRHFSRTGGVAYRLGSKLITGTPIKQDYLEKALKWISNGNIEDYMADHQHDENAQDLWLYFQDVISWVNTRFPNYRKEMKGQDWGLLYNQFKDVSVNEDEISELYLDDEVTNKKGIYKFVLSREEKYLSLRSFTDKQKAEAFEKQGGVCPKTGKKFETYNDMHADHIIAWSKGGKTDMDNLMMVCPKYNLTKSNK